jgi:hypothetical protein
MTPRERYIRDHAPTMLLIQALRAEPGAKLSLESAIRTAGALYDGIDAAVGASSPAGATPTPATRKTADHYGALSSELREGFDRFYVAYGVKHGKQRAAARWAEIAPDDRLAKRIAMAAQADHAQPRAADAVRKWPEGWLSERRWEDAPSPGETPGLKPDLQAQHAAQVRELINERNGLTRLAATGDPHIAALLADVSARLAALGVAPESAAVPLARPQGLRAVTSVLGITGAAAERPGIPAIPGHTGPAAKGHACAG